MYKLLIVTPNLTLSKELINTALGEIPNIQLVGISTCEKDFEYFKNRKNFDFILFHECEFDYHTIEDEVTGIICIGEFKLPVKRYEKRISISNKSNTKFIIKQITNFSKKITLNTIRQKAIEILLDLGFNFKHIGTKYLADAICYCYSHGDCEFENLERDIFPYIAKTNNTQVENVKWSLTRTTNLMYLNHTTKSILKLEKYFYLERFEKPTPKQIIGTITNNLLVQYQIFNA